MECRRLVMERLVRFRVRRVVWRLCEARGKMMSFSAIVDVDMSVYASGSMPTDTNSMHVDGLDAAVAVEFLVLCSHWSGADLARVRAASEHLSESFGRGIYVGLASQPHSLGQSALRVEISRSL